MIKKYFIIIGIAIISVGIIITCIQNFMKSMMDSKPAGPYHSSVSIQQATEENVLEAIYFPDRICYYSSNGLDSFSIAESWIESNENYTKNHVYTTNYKHIINICFNRDTRIHKFRLFTTPYKLDEIREIEHPDGSNRIRFLTNQIDDTIKLEVIERNPTNSIAWLTEKIIDTIILTRQP